MSSMSRIITANGREFSGHLPEELQDTNSEMPFGRRLAKAVGGLMEVTLPVGRADVLSRTHAFEVESVATWREGARQAYAYGAMSGGLVAALAVFGHADRTRYLPIIETVEREMHGLELWIYDHGAEVWLCCDSDTATSMRIELAQRGAEIEEAQAAVQQSEEDARTAQRKEREARQAAYEAERATWDDDYRNRVKAWEDERERHPRPRYECPHGGAHADDMEQRNCRIARAIKSGCDGPPLPPAVIDALRNLLPPVGERSIEA